MRKRSATTWCDNAADDACMMPKKKKAMPGHGCEQNACPPSVCPDGMMLAHAYVPWQVYCQAFSPSEALCKGTLFPELWGVYPIPE